MSYVKGYAQSSVGMKIPEVQAREDDGRLGLLVREVKVIRGIGSLSLNLSIGAGNRVRP